MAISPQRSWMFVPGHTARFVRLSSITSPWFADDVESVVVAGLEGVCLPKVEPATEVQRLAGRLDELERQRSMTYPS
jgi:citrate lyase beta subunit